jgi:signal transduction histidine kinase
VLMDNKTLAIAVAILSLLFAINVLITSIQRKSRALNYLSGSFLSLAVGFSLVVALEGKGHGVAAFCYNQLLFTFYVLYYAGIRHYAGLDIWPRRFWTYLFACLAGQLMTAIVLQSYSLRVAAISTMIVMIYSDAFISTIDVQSQMSKGTRLITRIFLFGYPAYILTRLVVVVQSRAPEKFLTDNSLESTITLVFMMLSCGVYAAIATIVENQQILAVLNSKNEHALDMVEKLRESDKNKTTFLGILSHELRNPLASISMGLTLLNKQIPAGETGLKAHGTTDLMDRQVSHLTHLVDDLLDITRINQHRVVLKKERIDLKQLLHQIIEDYKCQFAAKEVNMVIHLDPDPIILEADPVRLTQVVGNLLHNAVKFTECCGAVLFALEKDEQTKEVVIKVKDNGIGIEPSILPTLFEQFKQVDQSINRGYGGLGLGLSIAKSIIDLHGGQIEAASEGLSKGACFTVRLPLQHLTDAPLRNHATKAADRKRDLSILIIEDNTDLNAILGEMLKSAGHKIAQATDGPAGLAKAKAFKPDAVICDIGLPGLNGYEVATAIRSDSKIKDTYLIAFSGYAQSNDIEKSQAAGFDKHLAKPVDYDILFKILAEV